MSKNDEMKKILEGMMAEKIAIDNYELDVDLYDYIQFKEEDDFTRKNRRRGKKFNKSSWCRKEHKKALHRFDWRYGLNWWQPVDTGITKNPSDPRKGVKVRLGAKKECRDALYETNIISDHECVIDIDEEDFTWQFQSLSIGENLGYKVWNAWYDYALFITMEATGEFDKIAMSLQRLSDLNDTLQSEKLEQNILNLWDALRNNHKF